MRWDGGNANFGSGVVFDGWENENGDDGNEEPEGTEGVIGGLAAETLLDGVEGCGGTFLIHEISSEMSLSSTLVKGEIFVLVVR